jgi:hypothetical protein
MKKISLLKSLLFASLLITAIAAAAQTEISFASLNSSKRTVMEIETVAPVTGLKEIALVNFHFSFPDATEVTWYNMDKGQLYVAFNTAGKQNRAMYNKKGKMFYKISYYSKEMLPASVLKTVKDNYCGKSIFGITEMSYNQQTVYELVLQDDTSWTNIKISGNQIIDEKVWKKA